MATFRSSRAQLLSLAMAVGLLGGAATSATAQDGVPCPPEPITMAIAYGDAVTCSHQAASDADVFTFAGVSGEVIVVNAVGACMTLTAPAGGTADACATGLRNRLDVVLDETGTFTVTTRGVGIALASYTVALERLVPVSPGARALHYGDTLMDQINVAGDIDVFSFDGAVDDTVTVLASTTEIMPPCIELIAPDHSRSTACGFGQSHQIQITLLQSGSYAILVRQGDTIGFTHAWSYAVRVLCIAGSCHTAPLPPIGLTGTAGAFATTLTWNAPSAGRPPTSYVVEAGNAPGGTDVVAFDTGNASTTFMAPGVPNGTYFFRVKSRNSVGTSAPSNEIALSGPTGCALPAPPPSLNASVAGLVVSLQWASATDNPTSYVLEAGTSPGSSNIASLDVGLTTQFTTPAPPGTYFVRVRTRNPCGLGVPSQEVTVVVGCSVPPSPPPDLVVTVVGSAVTLSWPAASGQPAAYSVEAGSGPGRSNLANVDVGNQLTFGANAPPGTYFVRVRARNACGASAPSVERTVVVR